MEPTTIEGLTFATPKSVVATNTDIPFRVIFSSGTNISCKIDYNDSVIETKLPVHELSHVFPFVFLHKYQTEVCFEN